jgi:hypothetical protein
VPVPLDEVEAGADVSLLDPPTTPPTTAATMIMIRSTAKSIQKYRRRKPNIFFLESGPCSACDGSMVVGVVCCPPTLLASTSEMSVFSSFQSGGDLAPLLGEEAVTACAGLFPARVSN